MIFNIQALRAIAAWLVVIVHLEGLLAPAGLPRAATAFGNCGVDLFFVVSGFVMVHTTARRPTTPGGFLVNRVVRIVPLYWLLTLAVYGVALAAPTLLGSTEATPAHLVKSLLFVPFANGDGEVQPVLFLGWTLNYEMAFYLLFAAALPLAKPAYRVAACSAVLAVAVAAGAAFRPEAAVPRFYGDPIMLEFAFGMALGILHLRDRALATPLALALLVAGVAILIGHAWVPGTSERVWWSGLPATAIVAAALSLERRGMAVRAAGVQLLGAASYALYLVHPFVTQAIVKLAPHLGGAGSMPALAFLIPLTLAAVAGVAIAVNLLVERPMTLALRRAAGHRPSVVERSEGRLLAEGEGPTLPG